MKSLPTPLSVIAATPRKELENKFIFNPYTNKVSIQLSLTYSYRPHISSNISTAQIEISASRATSGLVQLRDLRYLLPQAPST